MAGDWVKIEKSTARKPEVLHLASICGVHPDHAFGMCVRFWAWCDDQMAGCHAKGVTFVTLDSVIGHTGFCDAMQTVGWLKSDASGIVVPNFDTHLSKSAKKRAEDAKRQAAVRKVSQKQCDKSRTKPGQNSD